jgi:hypothetical protein
VISLTSSITPETTIQKQSSALSFGAKTLSVSAGRIPSVAEREVKADPKSTADSDNYLPSASKSDNSNAKFLSLPDVPTDSPGDSPSKTRPAASTTGNLTETDKQSSKGRERVSCGAAGGSVIGDPAVKATNRSPDTQSDSNLGDHVLGLFDPLVLPPVSAKVHRELPKLSQPSFSAHLKEVSGETGSGLTSNFDLIVAEFGGIGCSDSTSFLSNTCADRVPFTPARQSCPNSGTGQVEIGSGEERNYQVGTPTAGGVTVIQSAVPSRSTDPQSLDEGSTEEIVKQGEEQNESHHRVK